MRLMGKRKKDFGTMTAAAGVIGISVHDRRAKDFALQAETAEIDVDDPYATTVGEQIRVVRQLRNDPLARLHSHHQIDEAQYRAGRCYQRDWEVAERGARAIDPTREAVDGGRMPEPLTDQQAKARKRLVQIERALGRNMHKITHCVLIEGLSMDVTSLRLFNRVGKHAAEYAGRQFRDALDVLAVEYNLAGKR